MKENSILENIHNALLPYPGRMNQTVRTVISCVFVVIISLSLQIPYIPLSIIVVNQDQDQQYVFLQETVVRHEPN